MRFVSVVTTALLVSVGVAGIVAAEGDVKRSELPPLPQVQIDESQEVYDPRDNPLSGENIPFQTGNPNNAPPLDAAVQQSQPNADYDDLSGTSEDSPIDTRTTAPHGFAETAVFLSLVVGCLGLAIYTSWFSGKKRKTKPVNEVQEATKIAHLPASVEAETTPQAAIATSVAISEDMTDDDGLFASRWAAAFFWFFFGGNALGIVLALPRVIADIEDRDFGMLVYWGAAALGVFGAITRQPLPWLGRLGMTTRKR